MWTSLRFCSLLVGNITIDIIIIAIRLLLLVFDWEGTQTREREYGRSTCLTATQERYLFLIHLLHMESFFENLRAKHKAHQSPLHQSKQNTNGWLRKTGLALVVTVSDFTKSGKPQDGFRFAWHRWVCCAVRYGTSTVRCGVASTDNRHHAPYLYVRYRTRTSGSSTRLTRHNTRKAWFSDGSAHGTFLWKPLLGIPKTVPITSSYLVLLVDPVVGNRTHGWFHKTRDCSWNWDSFLCSRQIGKPHDRIIIASDPRIPIIIIIPWHRWLCCTVPVRSA